MKVLMMVVPINHHFVVKILSYKIQMYVYPKKNVLIRIIISLMRKIVDVKILSNMMD